MEIPNKEKMGDRFESVYVELIKILRRNVREEDIVGRENGNLAILLPETDRAGSQAIVQRLSNLIQTHPTLQSDEVLKSITRILSFRSFTYPDEFLIPESLGTVIEEINKEYTYH